MARPRSERAAARDARRGYRILSVYLSLDLYDRLKRATLPGAMSRLVVPAVEAAVERLERKRKESAQRA